MKSHIKEFGFYSKCGQRPLKSFKQTDMINLGCEKATQKNRRCVEDGGKEALKRLIGNSRKRVVGFEE